jgi:spermidine synthase
LILLAYFLSGAAALLYEVLWLRELTLFCGHTTLAASTVLSAFMGGLALGSALGGRRADRIPPGRLLSVFAALEVGAAATALLSIPLLAKAGAAALALGIVDWPAAARSSAYFAAAFAILLVPTTLMGATLPVLAKRFGERRLATLYGVNTLGAVLGVGAAGFLLLPGLGVTRTAFVAAALNLLAALLAWLCRDGAEKGPAPAASSTPVPLWAAGLLAATGAAAMICEVAWTRAFALVLGSTTYAFSIMLLTFLLGLAGGSLAFRRLREAGRFRLGRARLGAALAAAGALVFTGLFFFDAFPYALVRLSRWGAVSPGRLWSLQFGLCALVMLGPTLLMGAVFPWVVSLLAPEDDVASVTGRCYAANTVGAIAGSAGAGLVLIPALGVEGSLVAAAAVYFAAAALCVDGRRSRAAFAAAAVAIFVLRPQWDLRLFSSGMFLYGKYYRWLEDAADFKRELDTDRVLFHESGRNATVTVLESPFGERYLRVNGKTDASEGGDMGTQLLLGYIPSLLHPGRPKTALVVGFGGGFSAGALATDPDLERIDVVEIEPKVVEAARYFDRSNRRVLDDPRVSVRYADARQVLASPGIKYDLISSEPSNPWISGIAYLFTKEAFEQARSRLAEDGVFAQWFHSYFMTEEDFRMVVRTFLEVFPHAALWTNGEADYFLIGRNRPFAIDYERLAARYRDDAALRGDLRRVGRGFDHPFTLLASAYALGGDDLKNYAKGAPLHLDDRPVLEFAAARSIGVQRSGKILEALGAHKSAFLPPGLTGLVVGDRERAMAFDKAAEALLESGLLDQAEKAIDRAAGFDPKSARTWTNRGRLEEKRERYPEAKRAFEKAVALDPEYAPGRIHFGMYLASRGEIDRGLAELQAGLRLEPDDALAILGIAWIDLGRGRKAEARALLERALDRPIPDSVLRKNLVEAYREGGGAR